MFKRRNLTPQENAKNINFSSKLILRNTELLQDSVIKDFCSEKCTTADGTEIVSFVDPILMLFNQQRLETLGQFGAKEFLDSFNQKSTALDELRSKCSDDDLMKLIKSRHLQSPAEILSWCRYMQQNIDTFNAEVQKLVEQQKAAQMETGITEITEPKS